MEEPPKIERIVASRGVSLSDTASILKRYISTIDQHHLHHEAATPADDDLDDDLDEAISNAIDAETATPTRKSRQELEEERLIAQMDRLADTNKTTISDDVYERLKMITDSICAEVEGKPLSASAAKKRAAKKRAVKMEEGAQDVNIDEGAEEFLADLEEVERAEEEAETPQQTPTQTKRDKKKEKKAKKAAKKAKKEAKRKAKELEGQSSAKKVKVES
ncbi:hypothetical protein ACHAXT_006751 [Thalassiosira profunda]